MTTSDTAFIGSTPENYDYGLGPMFFEPYAADIARRIQVDDGGAVLETAAGTGIVTRQLLAALGPNTRLVATDLNAAMLEIAQGRLRDPRLEWKIADAGALPFGDSEFDAVVCQFGLMFFPDKVGALREARRVLKSGGRAYWSTWGSLADNPIARLGHEAIGSFFPDNPPPFYEKTPFGLYDCDKIRGMAAEAGFSEITHEAVELTGESETAERAARGLVLGTPVGAAIQERGTVPHARIMAAAAANLAAAGGARPLRLPMLAHVFTARK